MMEEPIGLAAVRTGAGVDVAEVGAGIEHRRLVTLARRCLLDAGYTPLEVENPVLGDPKSGKAPVARGWQIGGGEPDCVAWDLADAASMNTGILCNGLRIVDIDVDDPDLADAAHELAEIHLGVSPSVRTRAGTGRRAVLYRAASAEPPKRVLCAPSPSADKIEVLGAGQQLVVYGRHWTGHPLLWHGAPGILVPRDGAPEVGEQAVTAFFDACAEAFGWPVVPPPRAAVAVAWRPPAGLRGDLPIGDVRKCFDAIPNFSGTVHYDKWLRLGMSAHAATGGSAEGLEAWIGWSGRQDANTCRQKWRGFGGGAIGPGTLVHEARLCDPALRLTPRHEDATPARSDMAKLVATMRKWKEVARRKG